MLQRTRLPRDIAQLFWRCDFFGAANRPLPPTFLMGGTLPVLVARACAGIQRTGNAARGSIGSIRRELSWERLPLVFYFYLYWVAATLAGAVALNLLAGALALRLSRDEPAAIAQAMPQAMPEKNAAIPHQSDVATSAMPSRFLYICFALVGATAMAYEIGWTRLLSTQLGSSTYAFTLMLVTFLTGIVLGSAIFERWNRRHEITQLTFALTQFSRPSVRWHS